MVSETRIITKRLHDRPDDSWTIAGANATGAYEVLRDVLRNEPGHVAEQVKGSGLRGRGGAGFPTAQKWSFLPPDSFPRYLVVNADEGEPSTFKDRMLLERDPHQLLEGIAIAAYAISCNLAFVYIRGEMALGYERLMQAIADAKAEGFLGSNKGRVSTSTSSCTAARVRTSAAKRPHCSSRSKANGACRAFVRRSRRSRASTRNPRS
jgi:NADH-quinone oxidoreductase subunit F